MDAEQQNQAPEFGADRVNDELEVGYDQRFERSWHWAEIAGRVLIVLVVLAGLGGLFGRGPFSHRTVSLPGDALAADFEPVARSSTPTQVTLHVRAPPGQAGGEAEIEVSSTMVEPLGLQSVEPTPVREYSDHGNIVVRVALAPGADDSLVRFHLQPMVVGPVSLSARLDGGPPLRWTQVILP